jgi:sulfoxide reductase heme-binding subunit YedZ
MLGLFSFFYASLHFLSYVFLDRLGASETLSQDLSKRPFIAVGFCAFALLVPLAATSTSGSIKALGAARWRKLHRLAYLAAGLAVLHFFWRVKRDVSEPLGYGLLLASLFAVRIRETWRKHARGKQRAA